MKRILFPIIIAVLAYSAINCNNTKELTSQTEALFRNKWKLAEVNGQAVPDSTPSSFEFTPGKISGSTGCNRVSSGFVAGKKQSIKFSPGASTKMACISENAATLETKFLDALAKSTKWSMENNELRLSDESAILVKLKPI